MGQMRIRAGRDAGTLEGSVARKILDTLAFVLYVAGFAGLVVGFLVSRAVAGLVPRRWQSQDPEQARVRHAE